MRPYLTIIASNAENKISLGLSGELCKWTTISRLNMLINRCLSRNTLQKQECIPVGCVPSAAAAARGVCIPACTGLVVSARGVFA